MINNTHYIYFIGTCVPGANRGGFMVKTYDEESAKQVWENPNLYWHAVGYWTLTEGEEGNEFTQEPKDRRQFYDRAKRLVGHPHFNSMHGEDSYRELEAWAEEVGLNKPPSEKVEPFWWDRPGTIIDVQAAWAATVAIAKGA